MTAGVRLSVERNSFPPGVQQSGERCQEGLLIRDVLDHLQRSDDRELCSFRQQVLGDAHSIGERQTLAGGMGTRCFDHLVRPASRPRTSKPRRANASAANPAPQPTSSSRGREAIEEGAGCEEGPEDEKYSPSPCGRGLGGGGREAPPLLPIRSTIHRTRAGFIRCNGRIGPSGSHQRAASASNCATLGG